MRRKKVRKSNPAYFYLFTVLFGIGICFLAFKLVTNFFSSSSQNIPTVTTETSQTENKFTALIKKIDGKSVDIFNINNENASTIEILPQTEIFDEHNTKIDLEKLSQGKIVDVTASNGKIKSLAIKKEAWIKKRIKDFSFNRDRSSLNYDGISYSLSPKTIVFSKGQPIDINKVSTLSIITISGLDENIWSIEVNKGTGKLELSNKDKVVGGIIKIDSETPVLLKDFSSRELLEGTHSVNISGDNIEPFNKNIMISQDKTEGINLDTVQLKTGILRLKTAGKNVSVYIDDKLFSMSEPILLEYGKHNLKVTKNGFNDYTQEITINTDMKEIEFDMAKKINLCDVRIITSPGECEVFIDDAYIGLSPVQTSLEYGKHTIYAKKEGYLEESLPVDLRSKTANYKLTLESDYGQSDLDYNFNIEGH